MMLNTEGFKWTSYARTDVGKVRKINEDAVLDHGGAGIWAVADGMGGHAAGDVASSSIVQKLAQISASGDANELVNAVENHLLEINTSLVQQAAQREDQQTMGSTVVVFVAFHAKCFLLWAGDSRAYRVRDNQLARITIDHSKVQKMVDEGFLTEQEAEQHPDAHVITRAIGASGNLFLDLDMYDVESGDRYMICSDGLYKEVMDEELPPLISQGSPQEACDALIDLALERGSKDNVTVVVIQAD